MKRWPTDTEQLIGNIHVAGGTRESKHKHEWLDLGITQTGIIHDWCEKCGTIRWRFTGLPKDNKWTYWRPSHK